MREMMRKYVGLTLLSCFLLSGLAQGINASQLQVRGELAYEINTTVPFSGEITEAYDSGHIKSSTGYKKGRRHGKSSEYFDSGQIKSSAQYEKGLRHGRSAEYFENGVAKFLGQYHHGQLDGKFKKQHRNGNISHLGEMFDGSGSEFIYDEKEFHFKTISYKNHEVLSEVYIDLDYGYKLMLRLADFSLPEDQALKTNLLQNIDSYPSKVFSKLLFEYDQCSQEQATYYSNGQMMCSMSENYYSYFYPTGALLVKYSHQETVEQYDEEMLTINGESCGKQELSQKGKEYIAYFYPDCSIEWEEWVVDGTVSLSKYHHQNIDGHILEGYFSCLEGDDEVYFGQDVNCKKNNELDTTSGR
jgi:hypothetical protein